MSIDNKRTTTKRRKQQGRHQKRSQHFLKVYAPYIPLVLFVATSIFLVWQRPGVGPSSQVLSYATNVNISGLVDSTNAYRASVGASPLTNNNKLNAAAQAKAEDMVARNYWSHITPDGKEPWVFIINGGYSYRYAGENLAYGTRTSQQTVDAWWMSPPHKANIVNTNYTEVGFGFANSSNFVGAGEQTITVAMYAAPYTHSAAPVATPAPAAQPTPAAAPRKPSSESASNKPADSSNPAPAPTKHGVEIAVLDANGKPAAKVKVTLHSDPIVAYTNDQGIAVFDNVPSGQHTAIAETATGEVKMSFNVDNDNPTTSITLPRAVPANQTAANAAGQSQTVPISAKRVNKLYLITGPASVWLTVLLVASSIIGGLYLASKHSRKIHKKVAKGEKYIIKHPLLDATIIAFLVACYLLLRVFGAVL